VDHQDHRCLFIRRREQLVGRKASQETTPFYRPFNRLAPEQRFVGCWSRGHEGQSVLCIHQGYRLEVSPPPFSSQGVRARPNDNIFLVR
jgi:hypothetical protein